MAKKIVHHEEQVEQEMQELELHLQGKQLPQEFKDARAAEDAGEEVGELRDDVKAKIAALEAGGGGGENGGSLSPIDDGAISPASQRRLDPTAKDVSIFQGKTGAEIRQLFMTVRAFVVFVWAVYAGLWRLCLCVWYMVCAGGRGAL